ncbi:MAG: shikimate kinase [Tissierellia bacterium]|nr:shikimate kinase [Tissierellia bacterium]
MNNIVLIGMSGVGKTTVGKYIASQLSMSFVDTDEIIINRSGTTISNIFNKFGEEYFRDLEKQVVEEVSKYNDTVISTGGGVILNRINIDNLKQNGLVFLLEASIDTLYSNLKDNLESKDHRPLLDGSGLRARIEKMYNDRKELYISSADYIIHIDEKAVEEIGDEIISIFNRLNSCS